MFLKLKLIFSNDFKISVSHAENSCHVQFKRPCAIGNNEKVGKKKVFKIQYRLILHSKYNIMETRAMIDCLAFVQGIYLHCILNT